MKFKYALKRLTASDLTFFEWHYKNKNAGNQKAINLNADIFVEKLYPSLPTIAASQSGRIPVNLYINGPGMAEEVNLQRKIIKIGSYKNWRLNGEFIYNPPQETERFNVLKPGDMVVLRLEGELAPTTAKVFFVSSEVKEDKSLYGALNKLLAERKMIELSDSDLENLVKDSKPPEGHPIFEIVLEKDLEDTALGGTRGRQRILATRRPGRGMSKAELQAHQAKVEQIGQSGEEFVNSYLLGLKKTGKIRDFKWISSENVVAPYDFEITTLDNKKIFLDVKSTSGEFERDIHISNSELRTMSEKERAEFTE